jgi:hypothetical protein
MERYPSEIFGHPHYTRSAAADADRARHWCPFVDKICYKQSRLIDYPFGVCAAHLGHEEIALCPRRFLDRHTVFADIAQHHFKTTSDILVFPEIRLPQGGNFDFIMLKHEPMSAKIVDFVAIEFQTGQTSSTGGLVQGFTDFMAGQSMAYTNYSFGLNTYDIWKRTFTQVLNKGVIMENWGHKVFWIVQEPIYRNFETRYNLQDIGYSDKHATIFALYDLKASRGSFDLVAARKTSASIDRLFAAFRNNPNIPSLDDFIETLQSKMAGNAQLSLRLDRPSRHSSLDVKPPTSTGRMRESGDEGEDVDAG